jgi:hypothetical protein
MAKALNALPPPIADGVHKFYHHYRTTSRVHPLASFRLHS